METIYYCGSQLERQGERGDIASRADLEFGEGTATKKEEEEGCLRNLSAHSTTTQFPFSVCSSSFLFSSPFRDIVLRTTHTQRLPSLCKMCHFHRRGRNYCTTHTVTAKVAWRQIHDKTNTWGLGVAQ